MRTIFFPTSKWIARTLALLASLFLMQNIDAQVCSSPKTIIYGIDANGNIYPITVYPTVSQGAALNTPLSGSSQANGLGYNSLDGKFYYWLAQPGSPGKFISYNPTTSTSSNLSTTSGPTNTIHSGCVSANGFGYYCIDVNGNLYYYDIASNTWSFLTSTFKDQATGNPITSFSTLSTGDMAIDGNGNLWFVAAGGTGQYALYKLNAPLPTSAVASLTLSTIISPTNYPSPLTGDIYGIGFTATGQMYMSAKDNTLYQFNNNHTFTLLGTMGGSGITDLTSCNFPTGILPVTWVGFSATLANNNQVMLNWEVTKQIDNAGYYVEYSRDGQTWNDISFLSEKGSSGDIEYYNYKYTNAISGDNYFRIRQVDINGNFHYSTTELVTIKSDNKIAIWPNPATAQLNVEYEIKADGMASISDLSGRTIEAISLHQGVNRCNIETLPKGIYIITIKQPDGGGVNQKFIKQ
ncbi:MAG: T9SS type A sorting domain-containing protein [Sphingobacteriales bacterium]|nr:MAG: T9SS type A sorting domain-containing protein [Sphingobacteriales bacterium]